MTFPFDKQVEPSPDLTKVFESGFFTHARDILDIGCKDGRTAAYLSLKYPRSNVVGCDASKLMIASARKKFNALEYPNLSFIECPPANLIFQNQFDRVISFNCLHWTQDARKVLKAIYNSLKPKGKALLIASPKSEQDDLQTLFQKLIASPSWTGHFQSFQNLYSFHTDEEFKNMLGENSFSIDKAEQIIQPSIFENRYAFESHLKSSLTPISHLPEEQRPLFLDELFVELIEKGRVDSSEKITLFSSQIELLVTKEHIIPKADFPTDLPLDASNQV